MKNHMWLMHAAMRTSGSVRSIPGNPFTGTVRARAARGIIVLAFALGSFGAVAATSAGHSNASAHRPAAHIHLAASVHPVKSAHGPDMPWMY
jgi:hypothetical protein